MRRLALVRRNWIVGYIVGKHAFDRLILQVSGECGSPLFVWNAFGVNPDRSQGAIGTTITAAGVTYLWSITKRC